MPAAGQRDVARAGQQPAGAGALRASRAAAGPSRPRRRAGQSAVPASSSLRSDRLSVASKPGERPRLRIAPAASSAGDAPRAARRAATKASVRRTGPRASTLGVAASSALRDAARGDAAPRARSGPRACFAKPAGESTQAERAAPVRASSERDGAAERVAGDVRAPSADLRRGTRRPSRASAATRRRRPSQRRRLPEAGQVDRDDLALAAQPVEHRPPHLPLRADAVDQDERRPDPRRTGGRGACCGSLRRSGSALYRYRRTASTKWRNEREERHGGGRGSGNDDGGRGPVRLQELAKRHLWMHFTPPRAATSDHEIPIIVRGDGLLRLRRARQALPRRARRPVLREHRPRPRRRRPGRRRPGQGARLLHELDLRAPEGDRARRARGGARPGRPQPRLLHLRRLRGRRLRAQALPPVPQAHRQPGPLQGDLAQARLPRHDHGRAHRDRHPGRAAPVRAAVPGRLRTSPTRTATGPRSRTRPRRSTSASSGRARRRSRA